MENDINEIKNTIKSVAAKEGKTLKDVAGLVSKENDIKLTPQYFSYKLQNGKLYYLEAMMIARVLGYEIKWEKIK